MFGPGVLIFGIMIPLVAVVLVAYGTWELVRSRDASPTAPGAHAPQVSGSARSILDERFARGELDVDEYLRRRAVLDGTLPPSPVGVEPTAAPVGAAPTAPGDAVTVGMPTDAHGTGVIDVAGTGSEPTGQ